ncbi:MAG: hypothetical protein H7X85_03785, partial [Thermoanaerobaculia bacterium]|nr:hypothetical protein [Thermoanaerobaculia bacterium]
MTTDPSPPDLSPRARFWRSPHHLGLALATLGLGFASGELLGLLVGGTLYALGLVFLPDSGWFRGHLAKKREAAEAAEAAAR